jgi:hypothetical protein
MNTLAKLGGNVATINMTKGSSGGIALATAFARSVIMAACVVTAGFGASAACGTQNGVTAEGVQGGAESDAGRSSGDSGWLFGGGTASLSLSAGQVPAHVTIPGGANVGGTVTVEFGAPSASGALTLAVATNGCCGGPPDVTPNTLPEDNAPTEDGVLFGVNNAYVYLSFVNGGSTPITFSHTPALTLTSSGSGSLYALVGVISCQLDLFQAPSSWSPVPGAVVPLSEGATSASVPSGTPSGEASFALPPGQTIVAVGCD